MLKPSRSLLHVLIGFAAIALFAGWGSHSGSHEFESFEDIPPPEPGFCDHPMLVSDLFKDIGHHFDLEAIALTQAVISVEDEVFIGSLMNDSIRNEVGPDNFDSDPEVVAYLNLLLADILPYTTRQGLEWQVHLIDDPTPNAFAAPGGYLYVMSGLLDLTDNEAQLMGVLAHGAGHEELRHPVSTLQYLILLGLWDPSQPRLAADLFPLLKLPFSSRLEQDSDAFSVKVLFDLGYSPYQFNLLYQKMEVFIAPLPEGIEGSFADVILRETLNLIEGHPLPRLRACSILEAVSLVKNNQKETEFYKGIENLRSRIPMSVKRY